MKCFYACVSQITQDHGTDEYYILFPNTNANVSSCK